MSLLGTGSNKSRGLASLFCQSRIDPHTRENATFLAVVPCIASRNSEAQCLQPRSTKGEATYNMPLWMVALCVLFCMGDTEIDRPGFPAAADIQQPHLVWKLLRKRKKCADCLLYVSHWGGGAGGGGQKMTVILFALPKKGRLLPVSKLLSLHASIPSFAPSSQASIFP